MERKKVMLIEDEELILEGLQNIIDWQALSLEVVFTASNGEEALGILETQKADIIVTDISMPVMDGLEFLEKLRKKDKRTRCIILTGYEEFEYARKAILLDVEDYILKPIDEEKLVCVLKASLAHLKALDKKEITDLDDKTGWLKLLRGALPKEEMQKYLSVLPDPGEGRRICPSLMKISLESMKEWDMSDILLELKKEEPMRVVYLTSDTLLLLCFPGEKEEVREYLERVQNRLESTLSVMTFISAGDIIGDYTGLHESYQTAKRLQKYQLVEGFGSCITPSLLSHRQFRDINMDADALRRMILKKDLEGTRCYIEDLFLNNMNEEVSVDTIYQLAFKTAMLLSEIKREYQLSGRKNMHNLTEIVESIYQAQDIPSLKGIFISESAEIIACLSENDSRYTPVVKQIISEVQKNYREDMNLKTLSYKYHMNASYLGQIFQKEVGCSFAQYISSRKNSRAKELMLTTNMKINEIAKEVGYTDTSYFYRKFKQCYGVSPAAMREMKKY